MSAWIVDKLHIDYLVQAAMQRPHLHPMRFGDTQVTYATADEVGRELWAENAMSVSYRYRNSRPMNAGTFSNLPGPCDFDHESLANYSLPSFPRVRFDPVVALKAIDCYQYQSCEHPGWEGSAAHRFTQELRQFMVTLLPGYDEAPWGIDERTVVAPAQVRS